MQKISTPSVVEIQDSKILASEEYGTLVLENDPWDSVLATLDVYALDPASIVAGLTNSASPDTTNPLITQDLLGLRLKNRGFVLIGPTGSDAEYEGTTDVTFNQAISSLPPEGGTIVVLPSTYTFNSTCTLPEGVHLLGVHPQSVSVQGTGDFAVFELSGDRSSLHFITLENPNATTHPLVRLSGTQTSLVGCLIQDFIVAGIALAGAKSTLRYCRIASDLGLGVLLQNQYQVIERCSFDGLLPDGVFRFESSRCSVLSSLISEAVTGASFNIPAAVCANNKIVASHLGSSSSVDLSIDLGTATVRYANTPDTFKANENNFLVALKEYTGQPELDSTEMVPSNQFAGTSQDATSILSDLDLFVQRIYEERNWYLISDDPLLDTVGSPISGTLSWDGTTLTWPDFKLVSVLGEHLAPDNEWPVAAGSSVVAQGEAVVLRLDRDSPAPSLPTVEVLPLAESPVGDPNTIVLAFCPVASLLVWTDGFRIMNALTSFDVTGMPLPLARYIGVPNYYKNVPPMSTPAFSDGLDMTDRLATQSTHLKLATEKTNLWVSSEAIRSHPIEGEWLDTSSLPLESPSHLIQSRGTTYGLFPNTGFFKCVREDASGTLSVWTPVSGFTLTAPYVSMSLVGLTIGILNSVGNMMFWNPDQAVWTSTSPDTTTLSLPLPSTRVSEEAFGQSDFIFQTPDYSIFTLVDGSCVFYYQESNILHPMRPLAVEAPRGTSVIGRHWKDTGYNVARLGNIDTNDNGVGSTLEGLPLDGIVNPIDIPIITPELEKVKWDQLVTESFSHDPHSDVWLTVSGDLSGKYYILGGGHGKSRFHSEVILGQAPFDDFTPHEWLTSCAHQEVVAVGMSTVDNRMTVVLGQPASDPNLPYMWTKTVLGAVDSSVGSVGYIDPRSQDIHILTSDKSRSYRPTWWTYGRANQTWNSFELSDPSVPAAVANSFKLDVGNKAGWGIAEDLGVDSIQYSQNFLVRDDARGGRPTLYKRENLPEHQTVVVDDGLSAINGHVPFTMNAAGHAWFTEMRTPASISSDLVSLYTRSLASSSGADFTIRCAIWTMSGDTPDTLVDVSENTLHSTELLTFFDYSIEYITPAFTFDSLTLDPATRYAAVFYFETYTSGIMYPIACDIQPDTYYGDYTIVYPTSWPNTTDSRNGSIVATYNIVSDIRYSDPVSITLSEGVADVTLPAATTTSVAQFYGGFYQKAWNALVWATQSGVNQVKIFTYFVSSNTWNIMSLGTGGTFLSSIPLGVPSFSHRSGSLLSGSHTVTFDETAHAASLYLWTKAGGLIVGNISAHYLNGYNSVSWVKSRQSLTLPVFSANPVSSYSPILGASRNDLSVQIGSVAESMLPLYGAGICSSGMGIQWSNAGILVRQIDGTLWVGINRSTAGLGYPWIGNPLCCKLAAELTPNTATVGGSVVVPNLGYTDDLDYATDGTNVCLVYRDFNNGNKLGFIQYNRNTQVIVHHRGGFSNTIVLASTPKVAYNPTNLSWEIVGESTTGRLVYFRRLVASSVWAVEETWTNMLPAGAHPYMATNSGRNPSKPCIKTDGSFMVATENGVNSQLKICVRNKTTGTWVQELLTTSVGYKYPTMTITSDATAWVATGGGGLFYRIATWTQLPSAAGYSRAKRPVVYPQASSILVASAATASGSIPEGQEMLVWNVNLSRVKLLGAFTAKGRMQDSLYSGEEETNISKLDWTFDKKILYAAYRPSRTLPHWSLRGSTTDWATPQGESLLGSGRMLTLGDRHFREQWAEGQTFGYGVSDPLIFEYDATGYTNQAHTALPLAQRSGQDNFTSLYWPTVPLPSSPLFAKGGGGSMVDDTELATGGLVTSGARRWPIILGNTSWSGVHQAGPSVFSQGSMLCILPPVGMTNSDYFGASDIGSSNLFKLRAYAGITLEGSHSWYIDPSRVYTLVGPVTFQLDTDFVANPDALGAHLVLDFNIPSSLMLDSEAQPLSYWSEVAHSLTSYAVVLGEVREKGFIAYPAKGARTKSHLLIHGHLEPRELTSAMNTWSYMSTGKKMIKRIPDFDVIVVD